VETCASFFTTAPRLKIIFKKCGALGRKTITPEEALQALQGGRQEGLNFFFKLHYGSLSYFAFKLTEDSFLAEEMVSSAFIKLWSYSTNITSPNHLKQWLYQVVRNEAIDHLRKVKRLRVNQQGLQTAETVEQSVMHKMMQVETIRQILQALDVLPPKCREVFQLFFIQGKSYEEIGKELNISPHTVRNQKIRAVRIIREMLPGNKANLQ
jgi:RNA polymerase sigma-70 factor (family 1)